MELKGKSQRENQSFQDASSAHTKLSPSRVCSLGSEMPLFGPKWWTDQLRKKCWLSAKVHQFIIFLRFLSFEVQFANQIQKLRTIGAIIRPSTLMSISKFAIFKWTYVDIKLFFCHPLCECHQPRHPSVESSRRLDMSLHSQQPLNQSVHSAVVPCGSTLLMHRTIRSLPELSLMSFSLSWHQLKGNETKVLGLCLIESEG